MEKIKDPLFEAWRRALRLGGAVKELFVHCPKKGETVAAPIDTLDAARWLQDKGIIGIEAIAEDEGKIYYYILPEAGGEVFTECYGYWEAEAEKLDALRSSWRRLRLASIMGDYNLGAPPAVDAPASDWDAYVTKCKKKAAVSSAPKPEAPNNSSNIWLALALILIPAAILLWLINY